MNKGEKTLRCGKILAVFVMTAALLTAGCGQRQSAPDEAAEIKSRPIEEVSQTPHTEEEDSSLEDSVSCLDESSSSVCGVWLTSSIGSDFISAASSGSD